MSSIRLHTNYRTGVTTISNIFIDSFMPSANGSYVKVYLYLLRCLCEGGHNLTINSIADHLEDTEKDIVRALNYWEKVNLLVTERNENGAITSILLHEPGYNQVADDMAASIATTFSNSTENSETYNNSIKTDVNKKKPSVPTNITTEEAAPKSQAVEFQPITFLPEEIKALTSDEEVQWAMNTIELYLERTIRSDEVQLVLNLYETYKFSTDLILHLFDYCISKGKKHRAYIEKVALEWANAAICTPEQADDFSVNYNKNYNAVMRVYGLNRNPGDAEKKYINKWCYHFNFDLELIIEACNRCLLNIQKPDFKYTNSILESWHKAGVIKIADIEKLDSLHNQKNTTSKVSTNNSKNKNKFNAFPQRAYTPKDYSEMEKKLLEKRLEKR